MTAARLVPVRLLLTAVALGAAPRAQEEPPQVQARIDLMAELRRLDLTTEAGCKAAILRIEDPVTRDLWLGSGLATEVEHLLARARWSLEFLKQKPPALQLHQDARRFAAAHREKVSEALAKYVRAEEAVLTQFASATQRRDELLARSKDQPALASALRQAEQLRAVLERRYQELLAESDELSAAAFPPPVVAKMPWTDLLAPEAKWRATVLQGFEHRIESGTMVIQGPDARAGTPGILSIGEGWRDIVVDFAVTITSGSMGVYFRMGPTLVNTEFITLESRAGGQPPPVQGMTHECEASLIGSRFRLRLTAAGRTSEIASDIRWIQSRKGALGLVIPAGAEVKFTRLRIRVLR